MKYKRLYTTLVYAGSLIVLTACIVFLFSSYESLIRLVIAVSRKPYLEGILREKVFTVSKYALLRTICVAILIAVPLLTALLLKQKAAIIKYACFAANSLKKAWNGVKNVFRQNSKSQNTGIVAVLFLVAARSLYYITQYPLQYDELWSYNYFTAQPFYYSFVVSSNYPLYEISTGLFKYLPFSMQVNIRLPVLIAGLLACLILYACFRKYFQDHLVAAGGMAVFAFMPVTTFYTLYARGVMYNMVFAIIAVFAVLFWIRNKKELHYLVVYAIANVAGIYAMPTHIYLWAILFFLMLAASYEKFRTYWRYIVAVNTGAGILSFLLYTPILAGSGISFLLTAAGDSVSARPLARDLLLYNADVSLFFTGYTTGLFTIIAIASALLFISKAFSSQRTVFLFCCGLFLLPLAIYFFQNVQIPARALAFIGLLIPLLFSTLLASLSGKVSRLAVAAGIIATAGGAAWISHQHHYLNWSIQLDKQTEQLAIILLKHQVTTCYDNSTGSGFFYYYPALEYYYKMNNKPFRLYTSDTSSLRYKPLNVNEKYGCLAYPSGNKINRDSFTALFNDEKSGFTILVSKNK